MVEAGADFIQPLQCLQPVGRGINQDAGITLHDVRCDLQPDRTLVIGNNHRHRLVGHLGLKNVKNLLLQRGYSIFRHRCHM